MTSTIRRVALVVTGTAVAVTMLGACASSKTDAGSPATSSSRKSSVSKGIGSKDARADVTIGLWKSDNDPYFPTVSAPVTVANHSHKRSDYVIDIALESANGNTQFDTTTVLVNGLEPGQSTFQKAEFFQAPKHVPATAKVTVKTIERTESL
jgi:hypothetical protein